MRGMHGQRMQDWVLGCTWGAGRGCWAVCSQGVQQESAELSKGGAGMSLGRGCRVLGLHGECWDGG